MQLLKSYGVSSRQWARWSSVQKSTFVNVFARMDDQSVNTHPKAVVLPKEHWNTIRQCAAFNAACSV